MDRIERIPLTGDRASWLEARRDFIGASEMAVVCGESGYASLAELFAAKKGLRPPLQDNAVLRRGRWGESAAFQALSDERPEWQVVRAQVHCIDRERRIACTPDGYCEMPLRPGTALVQAKVIAQSIFRRRWLDDPDDSIIDGSVTIPANYLIQCQAELVLNPECEWSVLACLINGEFSWHFRLFDIERDPVVAERILVAAETFHRDYLDPNIMPPFDPQRDEELIRHLYPHDNGGEIDLTGDNRAAAAVEEWTEIKQALTRLNKQEKELKTELLGKIGEHSFARVAGGRRLSCKLQHRKAHAVEASSFRVLRLQAGPR
jgi:predicted phage-related endonuclease